MEYQRRSVLFRFSPANLAMAGGRGPSDRDARAGNAWPDSWYDGLGDEQRAVLEPPYHRLFQRPVIADDGKLDERSRALVEGRGWDRIGLNDLGGDETLSEVKPKRPKL